MGKKRGTIGLQMGIFLGIVLCAGCGEDATVPRVDGLRFGDLGTIKLLPLAETELQVTVGQGTHSAQLVISGLGHDRVSLVRWKGPDGTEREVDPARGDHLSGDRALVFSIPPAPGLALQPGQWTFWLTADGEAEAGVYLTERIAEPVHPTVDVILIRTDADWGEVPEKDTRIEKAFEVAANILGVEGGVQLNWKESATVGNLRDDGSVLIAGVGTAKGEEDALYSRFKGNPGVLPVFLVDDILLGKGLGRTEAWSGGTPGPVWGSGAVRRGLLWVAPLDGDGEAKAGQMLAHAVSHYLGNSHTTEANGQGLTQGEESLHGQDGFASTPLCPDEADVNEDGFLTAGECLEQDGKNLMFWRPIPDGNELMAEQLEWMRRHPLVY